MDQENQIKFFFSNRVERLFDAFKSALFSGETDPFTKRMVIVPSPSMKNWLTTSLASDPEIGITAGVCVATMESMVKEIVLHNAKDPSIFPKRRSEKELAFSLEAEIKNIVLSFSKFSTEEKKLWEPLYNYIFPTAEHRLNPRLGSKELKRILSFSLKLANLFATYGKFGTKMLKEWKASESKNCWQEELWKRCVNEVFPEQIEWKKQNCATYLFGMSFISKQYLDFFIGMAEKNPVFAYVFSPCHAYWCEILSDRQCLKLVDFWEKKGVQNAQKLALEEYIYDRNPLLANFGRVGREMALQIEKSHAAVKESYAIPSKIAEQEPFKDLVSLDLAKDKAFSEPTLLDALHADLLLMRNPYDGKKADFSCDESIQVFSSSTPYREVQTVFDLLIRIIQKHSVDREKVLPEDIIVMSPDIIRYEPYIRAVFSQKECPLKFSLMDLNILTSNSLVQGYLQLLDLASSRWEASSVIALLENPPFQENQGFSFEDISKIKRWIKKSGVKWGKSASHRRSILKKEIGVESSYDLSDAGTWKKGIDRLLLGLVLHIPEEVLTEDLPLLPLENVESSQASLFGKWIKLMKTLEEDLEAISQGTEWTLCQWSAYLKGLLETYFAAAQKNEKEEDAYGYLLDFIKNLDFEKTLEKATFPFSTIKHHLEFFLEKQRVGYREFDLHAVRFCSMLPMRALPAKVVVLMGMSEGSYPRKDVFDSLNGLKKHPGSDYCPSQSEFDRYLFLEALLSARKYFILTYSSCSEEDGKEKPPSILLSELLNYLERGYTIAKDLPSKSIVKKTPFSPYDTKLFESGSSMQSYSFLYYKAAKALSAGKKQKKHSFISSFSLFQEKGCLEACQTPIEMKSLSLLAKNPIDFYFKNHLGMYLKEDDNLQKMDEDSFILDNLENYRLKKSALKSPLSQVLSTAEKEGRLPIGPFRNYSVGKLFYEVNTFQNHLLQWSVCAENLFEIHFSELYQEPKRQENGNWHLPPLKLSFEEKELKIVGKLSNVSFEGLFFMADFSKANVLKVWPDFLVFLSLADQFQLPLQKRLIFLKDGKAGSSFIRAPLLCLKKYIDYYFLALKNVSPLIPEWTADLVEKDFSGFKKSVDQILGEKKNFFYNHQLKWVYGGDGDVPDPELICKNWKSLATELFGELFDQWFKKGKKG